ncbi:hypothetical protein JCM8115_004569 [Rhodotorula mucilaginosa]|uniref:COP9 signalosome complex subunit 6 n=1 Tax=Rhodotorula mucilaginosa TaxID=5537 RepID=A0A9P6W8X3_RHOMI|nr:hypothetical protein C6P46_006870 [Rhodotorula mucilaginosa]TKA53149.1 hypothetical protein B0A53_04005 [Rhodotorula sp. CCFEE 5036]
MASTQGLKVALHPLAILSISEHYTRTAIQAKYTGDVSGPAPVVVGALLGTLNGRELEVVNSFELVVDPADNALDHAYLVTRRDQFKQVFPTFDFLGWYSIGQQPSPKDTALHQQFLEYNESPVFLQLSPASTDAAPTTTGGGEGQEGKEKEKDLPLAIYESVVELVAGEAKPTFVPVPYEVVTGEAERVAVEGVSKPEAGADGGAQGNLIVALTTQRNALQMLADRVRVIVEYLSALSQDKVRRDDETLRMIASLAGTLPAAVAQTLPVGEASDATLRKVGGGELELEFMTEYNDVLLTTYLSALTKQLETANALLDKQLLLVSGQSSGGKGEGGGHGGGGMETRSGGGGRRRREAA